MSLKSPKIKLTVVKQRICLPQNPHFQLDYATQMTPICILIPARKSADRINNYDQNP